MLTEHALMLSKPGEEDAFEAALRDKAAPILRGVPGVLSVKTGRGVENPDKLLLVVEWQDLAAHEAFKGTPAYSEMIAAMGGRARGGSMEHFEIG